MRKVIAIVIALISVLAGCSVLGSHLVSSRCRHRQRLVMQRREPAHTHHGRMHRNALDLRSSLEVHCHHLHHTRMNMEERRAR